MKALHVLFLALIVVTLFAGVPVSALELERVADVQIRDAFVEKGNDATFTILFDVTNKDTTPLRDVRYGVQLEDQDGEVVYTISNTTDTLDLAATATAEVVMHVDIPPTFAGDYALVAVVHNRSGALLSSSYIDDITVQGSKERGSLFCYFNPSDEEQYICEYTPEDAVPSYRLLKGGFLGAVVENGVMAVEDEGIGVLDLGLLKGRYGIEVTLTTSEGEFIAQQLDTYASREGWIAVSGLTNTMVRNGMFTADLFLEGAGESNSRGFVYAVIDEEGALCNSGEIDLAYVVPRKRSIEVAVPDNCTSPSFAGFLYDGMLPDGRHNIIEAFGTITPEDLIAKGIGKKDGVFTVMRQLAAEYFGWLLVILSLVVVVGYGVVCSRISHKALMVLCVSIVAGVGLGAAPVNAATFPTADNPNKATFSVDFKKDGVFTSDEDVAFTFEVSGKKPDTAFVRVDDGEEVQIMFSGKTRKRFNIKLPPVSTGGTHTVHFTIPDFCGSAFGYSTFGESAFGTDDCTFSADFEVEANAAPSPPQMRGACTVGAVNTFGFTSVDNDAGDQLYYRVQFGDDSVSRIPRSGYVDPYPVFSEITYGDWTTQGNKTVRARAVDTSGASSEWKDFTVMCAPVCEESVTCDGEDGEVGLRASPSLVAPQSTTTLHWELANVYECSLSGTNGDSWGWADTVSQGTSVQSGVIAGTTVYTLSCLDFDGANHTATTSVRLAPAWQEF